MVAYGGDEVSAVVIDIGTSTIRAGYAGDDTPKVVIPTCYGYTEESSGDGDVAMCEGSEGSEGPKKKTKLHIGHNGPSVFRPGMEVAHPVQGAQITDMAPVPAILSHILKDMMHCDASEHPVFVTEPAWNDKANRERIAEILFEEFQVPAFYVANTSVLNAFSAGKGSALCVDVGQSIASVTPIVDGFVLTKGLMTSTIPQFVHAHAKHILTNPAQGRQGIQLYPQQLIANKQAVEPGVPPRFTLREDRLPGVTDSWKNWYETREVDEWIQSVAGVLEQGWNEQAALQRGPRHYEFPTGFNFYFGAERFLVGEMYFTHNAQLGSGDAATPKTIPALISGALAACDPDMRQILLSNVVLTGGGSLLAGFADRLSAELQRQWSHTKVHAPGNPAERRFGGWLGGSIIASLGTFHQLWISREEWQEHGKAIVGQRCK